ncbi:MAG TPA: hypothetical protein VIG24_12025, partial [Acidimicrobiia bacterium]
MFDVDAVLNRRRQDISPDENFEQGQSSEQLGARLKDSGFRDLGAARALYDQAGGNLPAPVVTSVFNQTGVDLSQERQEQGSAPVPASPDNLLDRRLAARAAPVTKTDEVEVASVDKPAKLEQTTVSKLQALDNLDQRQVQREEARNTILSYLGGGAFDSDTQRKVLKGIALGGEGVLNFAGMSYDALAEAVGADIETTDGTLIGNSFRAWADELGAGADQLDRQMGVLREQDVLNSTPTGKWNEPDTWSLGKDPNLMGYAMHMAELGGQLATQAPMAFTKFPLAAGALMGGAQAGGAQMKEFEEQVTALSDTELAEASPFFRDMVAEGVPSSTARQRVMLAGGRAAAAGGATVGALGGSMTSYILTGLQKVLSGNFAGRITKSVLLDGTFESTQEVSETLLARTAANAAAETDFDVHADTFGDAVLGALGGAGTGAAGTLGSEASENLAEAAAGQERRQEAKAKVDKAVETGIVDEFLDESKPTYAPKQALDALRKHV